MAEGAEHRSIPTQEGDATAGRHLMLRGVVLHPVVARRVCDDGEFRAGVADEDAVAGGQDGDVLATVGFRAFAVSRGSRRPAAGFPQEKGPSADGRLAFPDVWEP